MLSRSVVLGMPYFLLMAATVTFSARSWRIAVICSSSELSGSCQANTHSKPEPCGDADRNSDGDRVTYNV